MIDRRHQADRLAGAHPMAGLRAAAALLLCVAGAWSHAAGAQPPSEAGSTYNLRPAWEPGQTALYDFWTQRTQDVTLSLAGRTRESTSLIASEGQTRWRVDQVREDGSAVATMTIEWIAVEITGPDGETRRNDSRRGSGEIPAYHKLLRAVAGVPLEVRVEPDGSIDSVRNIDQIRAAYGDDPFPLEDADFVESATDLAALSGPPEALAVGGSWRQAFDWSHELGSMRHDVTFRLDGVDEIEGTEVATVTAEARLKLDVDESELPQDGPPIRVRLIDGEVNAQVLYDLRRGEAVGRNSMQSEKIDIRVRLPQGELRRTLDQRVHSQLLRVEEQG